MHKTRAFRLTILGLLAVGLLVLLWRMPALDALESELCAWRQQLGSWGLLLLGSAYTPWCLCLMPASVLSLSAGYFYPVLPAIGAVSAGLTVAAALIFLLGRTLARGWVEARFGHHPRFQALDQAVAEQGFKIVLLTRLSPFLPFFVLNYAFSLTRVRFRSYLLASWLGTLPSTVLFVYVGSTIQDFTQLLSGQSDAESLGLRIGQTLITVIGLLATLAVTLLITRLARQALKQALPPAREEPGEKGIPLIAPREQQLAVLAESSPV